jgi:transcriptional regulator with XRE-family HTH domain
MVKNLEGKEGMTQPEIAKYFGMSTTDLRAYKTIANMEQKEALRTQAERLKEKQVSDSEGARIMGIPPSSYKLLLEPSNRHKEDVVNTAVDIMKNAVDKNKWIDVGEGVSQNDLNCTPQRMHIALLKLKNMGYEVHSDVPLSQLSNVTQNTKLRVLALPGTTWSEARQAVNEGKLRLINERIDDTGRGKLGLLPVIPVNPNRVGIVYGPDGGSKKDGTMYIREGAKDLDLGGSRYAQVRIQVGKGHYLKGMALYNDNLPDGVDILFHTDKKDTGNKLDALKKVTGDPDNPFGAQIRRQVEGVDSKGRRVNKSAVNIVDEEGKWGGWSNSIASQVLSKQSPKLARERLTVTQKNFKADLEDIKAVTNPTVRKKLLDDFAENADSAAVKLKAAALPRQAWRVILPMDSLKENEVYAPGYKNGETVALIRYPHTGRFEIPEVVVNNSHRPARKLLGDALDAVAINVKVAERLSGADFDGDTVLVIPNGGANKKISTTKALEGLKNFNPKERYAGFEGMKKMSKKQTGQEMGNISNLITDMTLRNAPTPEMTRAVRHALVVIDAEKHGLNYKQSELDNNIKQLKDKYQRDLTGSGGASTLISRARSPQWVPEMKPRRASEGGRVDPKTGELVMVPTGRKTFSGDLAKSKYPALSITKDAHTLSSGTVMEKIYADHSNALKGMANEARLESLRTPRATYNRAAKTVYATEVASIERKLRDAQSNAPLERRANALGAEIMRQKLEANPKMDDATKKKRRNEALKIIITPTEWQAIQQGAISDNMLRNILKHADMDKVREYATPKPKLLMTDSKIARAKAMLANDTATRADVAAALGVSLSTLDRSLGGEGE